MGASPDVDKVCTVCGASYVGKRASKYCLACRAELTRLTSRLAMRKWRAGVRSNPVRVCAECGREFEWVSGNAIYCPECSEPVRKRKFLEYKRAWRQARKEKSAD